MCVCVSALNIMIRKNPTLKFSIAELLIIWVDIHWDFIIYISILLFNAYTHCIFPRVSKYFPRWHDKHTYYTVPV